MQTLSEIGFVPALCAPGPHPDLGEQAATYGRFIGSWSGTYRDTSPEGTERTGEMEVHFAWVLRGRAVQDLWIARTPDGGDDRRTYGTTIRVYDPAIDAWRVTWINPPHNIHQELIGRRVGDDVVQTGYFGDRPAKWIFTDVTPTSFTWHGYSLEADGVTWRLQTEFKLRRDEPLR
jgi:hypothetical protein